MRRCIFMFQPPPHSKKARRSTPKGGKLAPDVPVVSSRSSKIRGAITSAKVVRLWARVTSHPRARFLPSLIKLLRPSVCVRGDVVDRPVN